MSSFPVSKAEAATVTVGLETALGVAPTAGFQIVQPNADGIGEFYPHVKTVAPSPLTKLRQMEAPQIVDVDATPKLSMDLTKDHTDRFVEGMFLARLKHPGGTGVAYWTNNLATPTITARTTTAYTVTSGGALQAGTLVVPRGWVTGANATANGTLQVVGGSATATSIPVTGGVAETPAGAYPVTLEVAGFRGAASDIGIDVNGNLTSIAADFTTMGLFVGIEIWLGGTVGGGHDFATVAYRGFAEIVSIAPNLITLKRRAWTIAAADPGTGKTIDLYWGRWARTVAFTDADYQEPTYNMELTYPKLSAGTTDEYVYSNGNMVDQTEISAPAQNLVTMMLSFIGTTIGDPTTTRITGPSSAAAPLAIDRYNTVIRVLYLRLLKQSDETVISDDVDSWKLTLMNHVSPQKQQGRLGTARDVVGKAEATLDATVFCTQDAAMIACSQNTTLSFGAGLRNNDGGIFFNLPSVKCTDAPPKFPGNGPVTLDLKMAAFRDATANLTLSATLFPFLPAA